MIEFRLRDSGQVVTEHEYRAMHPNVSFPAVLAPDDADPVLQSPAPATSPHQSAVRGGVVQDARGNWVYAWTVVDWTQEQIDAAAQANVPATVSMRQARLALLAAGLLPGVAAAMAAAGEAAQIEWEYATEIRRTSPLVSQMAAALGMADAQLDALFVAAAAL